MCTRSIVAAFLALAAGACVLPVTDAPWGVGGALAAPEPELTPKRWELRATFSPLRCLNIEVDGVSKAYYYLTYKVVNTSGQEVYFAPSMELVATDGSIARSGKGVSAEVTKRLIDYVNNAQVQDQVAIAGPMAQGEENAKEGIAIFAADNLRPIDLTLYVAGLSGEAATVKTPKSTESKDEKEVVLRKTRAITFKAPGDCSRIKDKPMDASDDKWVMR